ncbi:phosphoribosyl-AMP cyclohydrolase [Actinomycetaceae bacterium MB13-C1-2]|nr:phosphoribosyl-AMP cyclohydrolase [Actinomycetaceae bacterium MB13-C1-2]
MVSLSKGIASRLKRDANGLVCAVIQEDSTGEVLMVGWMNDEALARTLTEKRVTFWSRSRQELWRKGDTSGNIQELLAAQIDCDGDALLLRVRQTGGACHTGTHTCFEAGGVLPFLGTDGVECPPGPSIKTGGSGNDGS